MVTIPRLHLMKMESRKRFMPSVQKIFEVSRPDEFTGISPAFHQSATMGCDGRSAMKENTTNNNIVIPIRIERLKLWTRWTLEATTWLICLGLLAASVGVAACAALAWLVSGSETMLTLGLGGGMLLGLAGVWHLLHRLDRTVKQLRCETPGLG
jgi:hypothetical protein